MAASLRLKATSPLSPVEPPPVLSPSFLTKFPENEKRHYKEKWEETETSLYPKDKNITEELKVGLDNIHEDINNDEPVENIRESVGEKEVPIIPKYICINGSLSQKDVDRLVAKLEEDLTLLELIGIISNPNYRGSSKNTSTNKK